MPTATLLPPAAAPSTPPTTAPTTVGLDLAALVDAVAQDGIAAHEPAVADLVAAARAAGIEAASVDALADPRHPDVLRTRALAHVARHLAH